MDHGQVRLATSKPKELRQLISREDYPSQEVKSFSGVLMEETIKLGSLLQPYQLNKDNRDSKVNKASRTFAGKVLDVSGGVAKNGAPVVQWVAHGQNNQSWLILPADQPLPQGNANQGLGSGLGLGQLNLGGLFGHGSGFNWGNIPLNPNLITSQGTNSGFNQPQQALFKPNQHYAFFTVVDSNKVIDVSGNPAHKGELIIYDWHGQYNQKFTFEPFQGKYRIKSVENGLFVHITNDSEKDNVWIRTGPIGTKSDVWEVLPATEP
ncbi:unnamed protein product [Sphagnum balticum]